jgi:Flp pilus assembly pilin Flp
MKKLNELYEKLNVMLLRSLSFCRSEKGQTVVEYALLVVLISIIAYLMIKGTGRSVNCIFSTINCALGDVK